ncbi:MAG: HPP family protein [Cyanobacteria bacterium]|nr:HPP family protein [Cyanobacteriota bacterium]
MTLQWVGTLITISVHGLISTWSQAQLAAAPFCASTVLQFGHPSSALAKPRNIMPGKTLAASTGSAVSVRRGSRCSRHWGAPRFLMDPDRYSSSQS